MIYDKRIRMLRSKYVSVVERLILILLLRENRIISLRFLFLRTASKLCPIWLHMFNDRKIIATSLDLSRIQAAERTTRGHGNERNTPSNDAAANRRTPKSFLSRVADSRSRRVDECEVAGY